jgi:serine/threonine protein kinase
LSIKIGDTVGDYRVTGVLGAGGMGAVYEVRHLISDRTEAMKMLLPDLEGNADLAERFLREIRLQASLSHPGIATLHTALRHENQLLMVMEFVQGESLDTVLRRSGLDIRGASDVVLQILSALAYAHSRGVVHRDIKPANIVLMADGKAKLLDFGIARPAAGDHLTNTGATIGSLHYMSPEQIRGGPIDSRTDLYSTGITLYEMVTGVRPFTGADSYSIMKAQVEQTPPPPESLNPNIPYGLSQVLARALMKDPAYRFQTAEEFGHALERTFGQFGAATSAPILSRSYPVSTPISAPVSTPRPSSSSGPALVLFEPEGIERLTRNLAGFIGPVAKVLVSRASKKALSWDDLYKRLAAELPSAKDRELFLASRNR